MISICIPTFNNLDGLKRAVESSLIQTYTNFEIVITDDSLDSSHHSSAINKALRLINIKFQIPTEIHMKNLVRDNGENKIKSQKIISGYQILVLKKF